MKKIYIPIIAAILIGLVGFIWADTKEEIAKKANNETIMVVVQQMKEQRTEDKQERKEELQQQQETNKQIMQSIQMMLIQMATENK